MLRHEVSQLHTQGPLADLAYLRPDQVPRRYPFSKALVYHLLNSGDIKSVLVHKPGSVRGVRLVSAASIEAFLAKLAREQQDEGFTRAVAKEYNTGRKPRPQAARLASTEPQAATTKQTAKKKRAARKEVLP